MKKINDHVIYRREVCIIENIKKVDGKNFYVLSIIADPSLSVELPVDNTTLLKPLLTKKEAADLIESIPSIETLEIDEKFLDNEYRKLFNGDTREDLIKIIKTTYIRNSIRLDQGKKIQEKDNNYFIRAEKYFYNELSVVLGLTFDEARNYVVDKVKNMG